MRCLALAWLLLARLSIHLLKVALCLETQKIKTMEAEFDQIYNEFTIKRYRTFSPELETLAIRFASIGVELRRAKQIKDVLVLYKIICQNVSVDAIQVFYTKLIEFSDEQVASLNNNDISVDDLELPNFNANQATVLSDADQLNLNKVKFCWEIYKCMLDLLKNNNKFETLFAIIAKKAFSFCIKFQRKAEFKRYGEFLRNSLNNMVKSSASVASGSAKSMYAVDLTAITSSAAQLEVRLAQLGAAVELRCWSESYRVLDDLQTLFNVAKKSLSPQVLFEYFDKVSAILLNSSNNDYFLFSAAALLKSLAVCGKFRLWKGDADVAANRLCDLVLLAFIAIPMDLTTCKVEEDDRFIKISQYLGLSSMPTRESLLHEIENVRGTFIKSNATPQLVALFDATLKNFLSSSSEVLTSAMAIIAERYTEFHETIKTAINMQILKGILLYKTKNEFSLVDLKESFVFKGESNAKFERFICENAWKCFSLRLKINHQTMTVKIGEDLSLFLINNIIDLNAANLKKLQTMNLSHYPPLIVDAAERSAFLSRCKRIEEKQEKKEQLEIQQEQENYKQRTLRLHQEQEMEKIRLADETKKREIERIAREKQEIEREEINNCVKEFNAKCVATGKKYAIKDRTFHTKMEFMQHQMMLLEQDKKECEAFVNRNNKMADHFLRAIRQEEIPVIEKKRDEFYAEQKLMIDEMTQLKHQTARETFEKNLAFKNTLGKFQDLIQAHQDAIIKQRRDTFQTKIENAQKELVAQKQRLEKLIAEKAAEDARIAEQQQKQREEEAQQLRAQNAGPIIQSPFANRRLDTAAPSAPVPSAAPVAPASISRPFASLRLDSAASSPAAAKSPEISAPVAQPFKSQFGSAAAATSPQTQRDPTPVAAPEVSLNVLRSKNVSSSSVEAGASPQTPQPVQSAAPAKPAISQPFKMK